MLFVPCCLSPTNPPRSAELSEHGKFNPGIGETFPAWKPPPGQDGTFRIEGKSGNPSDFTKSLEAKLPEAFATHKALVDEGAARGLRRDLQRLGINGFIQHSPGFNTQLIPAPSKCINLMQFLRKSWCFLRSFTAQQLKIFPSPREAKKKTNQRGRC